jgi:hypothetical protein
VNSLLTRQFLESLKTLDKWIQMGFTVDEARRHETEVQRLIAELKNDPLWRYTATRDEMEAPKVILDYMAKARAERDDREWRTNLHRYLDEIQGGAA